MEILDKGRGASKFKKEDVELGERQAHITVNGKTGMRKVLLLFNVPFLGQYLNLIKDVKQNEPLWWNLKQSNIKGQLEYGGLLKMLKEVANAAGIEKRRYPHLFRHSRTSDYANRLTEQQLKAFFWMDWFKHYGFYLCIS